MNIVKIREEIIRSFDNGNIEYFDNASFERGDFVKYPAVICRNRYQMFLDYQKYMKINQHNTIREYLSEACLYDDEWIDYYEKMVEKEISEKGDTVEQYDSFEELTDRIVYWFDHDIVDFIKQVLTNDPEDPEYSPITCRNQIKLSCLYKGLPASDEDVKNYILNAGFSQEDYQKFLSELEIEINMYGDRGIDS